ncbi:MAG: LamG domain-containing protein, partial [Patescibacteria group bacterium]|nr:LamG domain-containing protein [Patescibacteria group bacterium]
NHEAVKIYQDGKLVGTDRLTTGTQPASFRNDRLFLGARTGFVAPLHGWLDEVKIEKVSSYVNDVANHADLVGYWRLGESAGTTAWEVKGTVGNGTYLNTTASDYSQPAAVNYDLDTAMQFNGVNSYVNAGNHTSLNGDWDGLTVAAWIKPENGALSGVTMIAGKWANSVSQDHFALLMVNGRVGIAVADGEMGENAMLSQATLLPDEWYFVAGTWDATTRSYSVYINGELDPATGTQYGNGINLLSTTTMKIGAQVVGQPRYFAGLIDEVAVFNTALGGEELMAYYRTAMVPEPSGVLLVLVGLLGLLGRRRRR